jgi:hypothetical protein
MDSAKPYENKKLLIPYGEAFRRELFSIDLNSYGKKPKISLMKRLIMKCKQ